MKRIYWIQLLMGLLVLLLFQAPVYGQETDYSQIFQDTMDLIRSRHIEGDVLTERQLFEAAMKGMFEELDSYSSFMTPSELEGFENTINTNFVGIGVQLIEKGDYIGITRVFDGTPAEKAGVLEGDYFISVDGVPAKGLATDEVVKMVVGEEGTKVKIVFGRGNKTYEVEITRAEVDIPSVFYAPLLEVVEDIDEKSGDQIAYIQISTFSDKVDQEFTAALEKAKEQGANYLILDMRDNGGGYVRTAVNVAKEIVPEGTIVIFEDKDGNELVYSSKLKEAPFEIVALVNEHSASATEFVAAAIQESKVGVLVGKNTFGKGVGQSVLYVDGGYSVKITDREFFSGNHDQIHGVGVKPDFTVEIPLLLPGLEKYSIHDEKEGVYYLEKLLHFLGYQVGSVDEKFDQDTLSAVKAFQKDTGLYSYGICDFTTQQHMNEALIEAVNSKDPQLLKAVSIILEKLEK